MKLSNLRPCDNCGGAFKGGIFNVVRTSLAFVSPKAANQVLGLNQYFGGALGLAEAMAPEPDAVKIAMDEDKTLMTEILLCQECFMSDLNYAILAEKVNDRLNKEVGDASV